MSVPPHTDNSHTTHSSSFTATQPITSPIFEAITPVDNLGHRLQLQLAEQQLYQQQQLIQLQQLKQQHIQHESIIQPSPHITTTTTTAAAAEEQPILQSEPELFIAQQADGLKQASAGAQSESDAAILNELYADKLADTSDKHQLGGIELDKQNQVELDAQLIAAELQLSQRNELLTKQPPAQAELHGNQSAVDQFIIQQQAVHDKNILSDEVNKKTVIPDDQLCELCDEVQAVVHCHECDMQFCVSNGCVCSM